MKTVWKEGQQDFPLALPLRMIKTVIGLVTQP